MQDPLHWLSGCSASERSVVGVKRSYVADRETARQCIAVYVPIGHVPISAKGSLADAAFPQLHEVART